MIIDSHLHLPGLREGKTLADSKEELLQDLKKSNVDYAILIPDNSAHACSEIGLKWFLFALHDLGTALGFVPVLDFSGDFVLLEHRRNGQNGIKTIFNHSRNTHARKLLRRYRPRRMRRKRAC